MSVFDTRTSINYVMKIALQVRGIVVNIAKDLPPKSITYYLPNHTRAHRLYNLELELMNEDEMFQSYVLLITNSNTKMEFFQNVFMNLPDDEKIKHKLKILKEAKKREIKKIEEDVEYLADVMEDYLC